MATLTISATPPLKLDRIIVHEGEAWDRRIDIFTSLIDDHSPDIGQMVLDVMAADAAKNGPIVPESQLRKISYRSPKQCSPQADRPAVPAGTYPRIAGAFAVLACLLFWIGRK